jgi:WD40 repeat protein
LLGVLVMAALPVTIPDGVLAQDSPTETYTGDNGALTFDYPAGWVFGTSEGPGDVLFGNISAAIAEHDDGLLPGQIAVLLMNPSWLAWGLAEELPAETLNVQKVAELFAEPFNSLGSPGVIDQVELTLGGYPAVRVDAAVPEADIILFVLDVGDGYFLVMFATTAPGEREQMTPVVLAIAESVDYDPARSALRTTYQHALGAVSHVAFSLDGTILATGGCVLVDGANQCDDGTLVLWDVASGEQIAALVGHTDRVKALAFSPDGAILASAADDGTARLWDVKTGDLVQMLEMLPEFVSAAAFSADLSLLAAGGVYDTPVLIWDVKTGEQIATLDVPFQWVGGIAFSPDNTLVATGGLDHTVRLWDTATGELLTVLEGHTALVDDVAFSPDGTILASASEDYTLRLWDVSDPAVVELLTVLEGHTSFVWDVTFSPDGTRLASAGWDSTVRLWDVASGEQQAVLTSFVEWQNSVAFSPDGTRLASGGNDDWDANGMAQLWDVVPR